MGTTQEPERARRSPWLWVAIAVVVVAAGILLFVQLGGSDEPDVTTTTTGTPATTATPTTGAPGTTDAPTTTTAPTTDAPASTSTTQAADTTTAAPLDPAAVAVAAAAWTARDYVAPSSGIAEFGTGALIDALVALALADAEPDTAAAMLEELRGEAGDYAGAADALLPGQAAKVVHVIEVYGEDPATFVDGRDFEAELRATLQTEGDNIGRFGEAVVYDQALALLALSTTDGGAPAESVTWLAAQACDDGSFTYDGTGCGEFADPDTTAMTALGLSAAGESEATGTAVDWLLALQQDDGALASFDMPNANTTAIAAQVFTAAGENAAADAAAAFIASLQFGSDAPEADAGGIRWVAEDTSANVLATIQGIWGLVPTPLYEIGG